MITLHINSTGSRQRSLGMACAALVVGATSLVSVQALGEAPPPASLARPADKAAVSKACIAAGRKLTREQQSLDAARADLDRYTKGRASCGTKSACARNEDRITALNKRIPRYETRLKTFQKNQVDSCKTG